MFPQILEMRISFASCRKLMTYNYYITQPMQAVEKKLNQDLAKNPELINFLNTSLIPSPCRRKKAHSCSNYNDQIFDIILSLV